MRKPPQVAEIHPENKPQKELLTPQQSNRSEQREVSGMGDPIHVLQELSHNADFLTRQIADCMEQVRSCQTQGGVVTPQTDDSPQMAELMARLDSIHRMSRQLSVLSRSWEWPETGTPVVHLSPAVSEKQRQVGHG